MHSLLSICMNENTSFTKMFLLDSLNAQTDHDVWLNKLHHKKSIQTEYQAASLKWDTVQDALLLQNRKFRQISSNLVSMCSSCPN